MKKKQFGSFVDDRDGKHYQTIQIGNQTWMAENLAYRIKSRSYFSRRYDDDDGYVSKYGYLYSWYAATMFCPKGWHLPSVDEWIELELALGRRKSNVHSYKKKTRGKKIGKKLKSKLDWNTKIKANNKSGFTALPGGVRRYYERSNEVEYTEIGESSYWWSSTKAKSAGGLNFTVQHGQIQYHDAKIEYENAICCKLTDKSSHLMKQSLPKTWSLAIRCVKD